MAAESTINVVSVLEDSGREFIAAAGGVSEGQAKAKPGAGGWSILECVEHTTTVEGRLLGMLERAGRLGEPCVDHRKEESMAARAANRGTRLEAPEAAKPVGRFGTLAEALEAFRAVRARTIGFAGERIGDLHWLDCEHPRFGKMNGAELLLVAAGHSRRHAEQIREIRAGMAGQADAGTAGEALA